MTPRQSKTKDPVRVDPLPSPGESLERQVEHVVDDQAMAWGIVGLFVVVLVGFKWWEYLFNIPQSPILYTVLAVPAVAYCAWKFAAAKSAIQRMRLGLRGEKAVGQELEKLRAIGYEIIHDLVESDTDGSEFNIDHILVGPGGIFVVETKTRSKPAQGDAIVRYDGDQISVDGGSFTDEPIRQVKAAVGTVRRILEETTGHRGIPAQPVVVYPGWFIKGSSSGKAVWVLAPKAFMTWIGYEPQRLSREDVALYTSRLADHVRLSRQRKKVK